MLKKTADLVRVPPLMGKVRKKGKKDFCVKVGPNEDQFSSLVLMRTKSLIEYLYAATALWTVLYPNQKVVARIYSNRYVEYCLHYRILLKLQDVSNEGNINGIKLSLNFFCAVFSLNIQRLISGQRSTRI